MVLLGPDEGNRPCPKGPCTSIGSTRALTYFLDKDFGAQVNICEVHGPLGIVTPLSLLRSAPKGVRDFGLDGVSAVPVASGQYAKPYKPSTLNPCPTGPYGCSSKGFGSG